MDRFKFRVWSNTCKCYIDNIPDIISETGDVPTHEIVEPGRDCIIEQCTGLKDCNDKLIFEGDVFIYLDDKRKRLVKWDDRNFMFEVTFLDCGNDGSFPYYTESSIIEIIENIHEVKND